MEKPAILALVCSCSGSSSATQPANRIALTPARAAVVEVSCFAGVSGDLPTRPRLARSGRPIVARYGAQQSALVRRHAAGQAAP